MTAQVQEKAKPGERLVFYYIEAENSWVAQTEAGPDYPKEYRIDPVGRHYRITRETYANIRKLPGTPFSWKEAENLANDHWIEVCEQVAQKFGGHIAPVPTLTASEEEIEDEEELDFDEEPTAEESESEESSEPEELDAEPEESEESEETEDENEESEGEDLEVESSENVDGEIEALLDTIEGDKEEPAPEPVPEPSSVKVRRKPGPKPGTKRG